MAEREWKVAVVGGGITGLSAAYRLQERARELRLDLDVTIIEASHRFGGKIETLEKNGYVMDRGPDSFYEGHQQVEELAEKLGILDQLVQNHKDEVHIVIENESYPVPASTKLGVPTKLMPFLMSGLLSWSGKIRAVADLFLPKSADMKDQPLGEFIRRRFGKEMAENLVEPLLADITASDLNRLSLQATFPEFLEIQQRHRSLFLGMQQLPPSPSVHKGQGGRSGTFRAFKTGMETLVNALEAELQRVRFLKNVKVVKVERFEDQAVLHLNNDSRFVADEVIFAVPHEKLIPLFEPHGLLKGLKDFPSTSVATVFLGFAEGQVDLPDNGTDFLISRNSDFAVSSATWMHRKWPDTAPPGKLLLRATVGRAGDEAVVELSDSELEKLVMDDLRRGINVSGTPEFTLVSRFKEGMPQYTVGHAERIAQARAELEAAFPMVQLAGSSFEGHRVAHCIAQGTAAADGVVARLADDKVLGEAR